jgi:hypothetical protein
MIKTLLKTAKAPTNRPSIPMSDAKGQDVKEQDVKEQNAPV